MRRFLTDPGWNRLSSFGLKILEAMIMMRALRDKKTMHVILWILLFVFVVLGVFFGFGMRNVSFTGRDDASVYAAKVGDGGVTRTDFDRTYQQALDRLYAANPEGPTSEESKRLQEQILDTLIDDTILEQTAQKLGITVTDEELAASIRRQPYFTDKDGSFDKDKYLQVLQSNQLTADQYENSERRQILMQKIHAVLTDSVLYTNNEMGHYASLLNRDLKAVYVSLDESAYEKNINAKEDDLKDFYETIRSQFDHPERVKVRHLFLNASQGEGFQDPEKTKKILEGYRNEVLSGKAKFEDLAKKYSQDESTKPQGGEIGWIDRGTLPKDVEDNIFGLKKGQVSVPFKLQSGYDIALVEDYEQAYKSTFEEVRAKVLKQYQKQKAGQRIIGLTEQISADLKDNLSLEQSGKKLGLTVNETGWFNRKGGIPHIENSKDTAMELASLYPQEWKGPLSLGQKEYFFQIVDSRGEKTPLSSIEKDLSNISGQMAYERQQSWLKDFLNVQRKKMQVKNFLNG